MSSCLALTGVCHAKKAGLRTSSHTLLVFWLHKEVWKWMGHTQTLMLRRSQKVNIFNTVTQFFFSLLHSNAATGSLSVLIMHLVVRNPFSCSLKSVPENLGTELNIVSLLRFQLRGMCICVPSFLAYHSSGSLCAEAQLQCQFCLWVLLGI